MSRIHILGSARRGAALLSLAASVTSATIAAPPYKPETHIGTRIPLGINPTVKDQTPRIVEEFASCIVEKRRKLASSFVLDRSTLGFPDKYESLADGACLGTFYEVTLGLGDDTMRFALAEALLRQELPKIDPSEFAKAAQLPIPLPTDYDYSKLSGHALEERRASVLASIVWYKFGDCAVRANPTAARALLQAQPGSAPEGAAIQALMPALGSCLEKGAQITLNRTKLRGAVAFSYYSLAHAPRAVAH